MRSSSPRRRSAGRTTLQVDTFSLRFSKPRRQFMRRYQWPIGAILVLLAGVLGLSLFASGATRAQTVDVRGPQTKSASNPIRPSSGQTTGAHAALPAPGRPNVVLYDQF